MLAGATGTWLAIALRSALSVAVAVLALGAAWRVSASPLEPPDRASGSAPRSQAAQRTQLGLPFAGTWVVGQGYHGSESHTGYAAFALDLVKVDARGRAYERRGARNEDWFGFGAQVLATAAGVVVRAIDRFPDNRVMGSAKQVNTLILEHGPGEFSEYVHLQRGSLRVRAGQRVTRGQKIARCGNSGAQTPHLHFALLSSIDPIRTRPVVFADYEVRDDKGTWRPGGGTLTSGDVIRPLR